VSEQQPISAGFGLRFRTIKSLAHISYSIVGDGEYVETLLGLIQASHGNMPVHIYVRKTNSKLPPDMQKLESLIVGDNPENIVLGSNLFQLEMMKRLTPLLPAQTQFIDVLAARGEEKTFESYVKEAPDSGKYLLFFAVNPIENIKNYVGTFFKWIEGQGIAIIIRHPLQRVLEDELKNAAGVLIWNGAMTIHQPILKRCRDMGLLASFIECGFFPQREYFYLDKCGINAASQLYDDDLTWVDDIHLEALAQARKLVCDDVQYICDGNYVFVPLQVPTDSNIINHSRFTNGMQKFIDHIEALYPDEQLWFKPHPKDRFKDSYHYRLGKSVEGDLNALIAGAKKVHGINSSVLYEAALMGKEVIVEGDCLLKQHAENTEKLLAAMLARQFHINDTNVSQDKVTRFSHLQITQKQRLAKGYQTLTESHS
jgi:hypothetical protein